MSVPALRSLLLLAGSLVAAAAAARLPAEVLIALDRAKVPAEAMHVVVQDVGAKLTKLSWKAEEPVNPASLTKLLTTTAALELLGPAWTWTTPVWLQGTVSADGVLDGNLVLKGSGDPKLVPERLWLLLRRVQALGVREIRGDIVLDRTAFPDREPSAAEFDNEPLRPYNVRPDALLLGYRSLLLSFVPDPARGIAAVGVEPALAGVQVEATVPLAAGACNDWRAQLKADASDATRLRLSGSYPASCGERFWPLAYAEPRSYDERLLTRLWTELGGRLTGTVREGVAPATRPQLEIASPALAEVIREINKQSNNVMAQQLFLTLGLQRGGAGTPQAARQVLQRWLSERLGRDADGVLIDNGSGLSRTTRVSAHQFALLLQHAWSSPVMPELMASLPVAGVDGTLTRSKAPAGRAHLKTGSLRDVAGVAGYVLTTDGRRRIVVGIVQHPSANAARPALDALIQWATGDAEAAVPQN